MLAFFPAYSVSRYLFLMEDLRVHLFIGVLLLLSPVLSCSDESFVADLQPCTGGSSCDWLWKWEIFTPLLANETYYFEGGNASISISKPVMNISTWKPGSSLLAVPRSPPNSLSPLSSALFSLCLEHLCYMDLPKPHSRAAIRLTRGELLPFHGWFELLHPL